MDGRTIVNSTRQIDHLRFRQYANTGEWFVDIDGKRIARKSIFMARVYSDPYDPKKPLSNIKVE